MQRSSQWFRSWEGLLLLLLLVSIALNALQTPYYLSVGNLINLFMLSIEKIIVALIMTMIIINGEIDLSVASVMGLAACIMAALWENGVSMPVGLLAGLLAGLAAGAFNGFWIAYMGLPSLAVTLAGLIGYRGAARILLEDRSIGEFPAWFDRLGQQPILGPLPLALIVFFVLYLIALVVLQFSGFGRYIYVIGNSQEVARYSGVKVQRVKMILFMASGLLSALAGLLFAARLGAVRGDLALGFELDIITMVLLGGVSIFGGTGSLVGVGLSILLILNLRNGMSLANLSGHIQTGVVGVLLILSVLVPNLAQHVREIWRRRRLGRAVVAEGDPTLP
ncbi:MAG: ABC transporter permease [Caldilineaceae bacterium]|nr:ABC transporter permease [Caldilineaceae bacterium]